MRITTFKHWTYHDKEKNESRDFIIKIITDYWGCYNPDCTCNAKYSITYCTDIFPYNKKEFENA